MLTHSCIEQIKAVPLSSILSHFLPDLKKRGVNHTACCPFHNEKSPSFSANDVKGIYKCFGCGASGNVISFVINYKRLSFIEACELIASLAGIQLQHEPSNLTNEQKQAITQKKSIIDQQEQLLNTVIPIYHKNLLNLPSNHPARTWLAQRGFNEDAIIQHQIGWGGEEWNTITQVIAAKNKIDVALKMGLIKYSEKKNNHYDAYKNRITIPIKDQYGKNIGIGGRFIVTNPSNTTDFSKWINPADSEIYNKSKVLFGLDEAAKYITAAKKAFVAEGYTDTLVPHIAGLKNIVSIGGTAFTDKQIQLLKKYTNHFVLWLDNDAAGINAIKKMIPELLKQDVRIEVANYPEKVKDPDEFFQHHKRNNIWCLQEPTVTDAVVWLAAQHYNNNMSPDEKQVGIEAIANLLSCISKEIKRDSYTEQIIALLKIPKKHIKSALDARFQNADLNKLDAADAKEQTRNLPEWADKDAVYNTGLDANKNAKHETGYYFLTTGGVFTQLTNFVLEPLFHLYDRFGNNRRLAILHNGLTPDKLVELPSKAFSSLDKFEELMLDEGYFTTKEGFGKPHLKRLFVAIGNRFNKANELKYLGWQEDGFWAFSNAIFDGVQVAFTDANGIVKFKDQYYYSPSSSKLYKNERVNEDGGEVTENDPYANDKHLAYKVSPVTFQQWAQHMVLMHKEAAMPLVCFTFFSVFKDIVNRYEKSPLLYGYGLVQSGKSTWAECAFYLFHTSDAKPFNLNQGTVFSFWNRQDRSKNIIEVWNEFDEDAIDEEYYRAFKGSYDGEGRDRGSGIKNKVETQKTNCANIIIGQTLSTKDGASVLIRSIPVKFHDPGERTQKEKEYYDVWTNWTHQGMSSTITEVLLHRAYIKQNFISVFNDELKKIKLIAKEDGIAIKERIAKNHCILLALGSLMLKHMNLGFNYQQLFDWCKKNIYQLSQMISEVDNLAVFWKIMEFLHESNLIQEGADFKIEEETQVRKRLGKEVITVPFEQPTKILYVRLTKLYPLYAQNFRQTTGNKPINATTLETYFESTKYYLGLNPGSPFKSGDNKRTVTSAYMFRYDKLNINLEREDVTNDAEARKNITINATVCKAATELNIGKIMFTVVEYYIEQDALNNQQTQSRYIKCFSNQNDLQHLLMVDKKVIISGWLSVKTGKNNNPFYTMDVQNIQLIETAIESPGFVPMPGAGFTDN